MKYNAYIHYHPPSEPTFIYTFDTMNDALYWKQYKESCDVHGHIYEIREE